MIIDETQTESGHSQAFDFVIVFRITIVVIFSEFYQFYFNDTYISCLKNRYISNSSILNPLIS